MSAPRYQTIKRATIRRAGMNGKNTSESSAGPTSMATPQPTPATKKGPPSPGGSFRAEMPVTGHSGWPRAALSVEFLRECRRGSQACEISAETWPYGKAVLREAHVRRLAASPLQEAAPARVGSDHLAA